MDNPPRPLERYANPGCYVPATDASSLTTYNKTYEAELQTTINDVQYLVEKELHGNASISTFDGSASAKEAMSPTWHGYDNDFSSVNSQGPHFFSSVEVSRGFNTLGRSRNHSDPYGTAMVSSHPTHNSKRSVSNYLMMNETNPDAKIFKAEIFAKRGKDLSNHSQQDTNYDKTLELNATSQIAFHNRAVAGIDGQHIESYHDLSHIIRNYNERSHISDVVASNSFYFSDGILAVSGSSPCYWNENTPNVVGEMFNKERDKKCRKGICAISDNVLSPLCKPGSMNPDFLPETIHKEFGNSNSKVTQHEFLNVEKPQSHNQVKQALCRLDKTVFLTVNNNTELNISTLQCSQKQSTPGIISDFEASSVENLQSMDDILAVQSPSDLCVNEHGPNLIAANLHLCHSSKVQSVQPGSQKKFPCYVCDKEIHEHAGKIGGVNFYFCCVCEYTTRIAAYLQMHSDIHCPQKVCNVCSKEYREGNLHDSEHTCKVCEKKFDCKTLLDQHSVNNEKYFLEHCWVCVQKIHDHFTTNNGRKIYVCCACNFRTKGIYNFKVHSNIHCPKLFCMICREEYPLKGKDMHDRKWTCIVCGIEFKCKTLLEDHSADHKDYFSSHCRICKETIDKHYIKFEEKLKCCFCAKKCYDEHELQRHLSSHTGLRLFKCDWCEKRYLQKNNLEKHSRTCIPLPYKCKICCARFPCNVSHDKHRLENMDRPAKMQFKKSFLEKV